MRVLITTSIIDVRRGILADHTYVFGHQWIGDLVALESTKELSLCERGMFNQIHYDVWSKTLQNK